MELHGKSFIGGQLSGEGLARFPGINAATGEKLEPSFYKATEAEIDRALDLADKAFEKYRELPSQRVAEFLAQIGDDIMGLGDELIRRGQVETALPEARLTGERARTVNQLNMFAELVREGSWVDARIDRAIPDRKPLPKPDLRRMLIPIGPVAVFSASNFPLAFSVAGGDTAAALAAGNPVVVKAHSAHPGTSELVARAVQSAAERTKMPEGVFSMIQGKGHEVGLRLVRHPATRAVGFTGSLQGGRALFEAAVARPDPIPVYAEMGSTNPVFILPGALKQRGGAIAEGLLQSVTLGVGQFCTCPGLVFGMEDANWKSFVEQAGQLAAKSLPGTMLYQGLCEQFHKGAEKMREVAGVSVAGQSAAAGKAGQATAIVLATNGKTFLQQASLSEELFGPSTLAVGCSSADDLERIARSLPGQLTATIHGTEEDLAANQKLISILQQKAGRLLFNGFPTGVEVCPSMHHGGPYPATTYAHFTSVGTAAIQRFTRPLCWQNFPDPTLPVELRNKNERGIWRLVDGKMSKQDL